MPSIVHGSRVYQNRSENNFKESWLSLDENGNLAWKRKDAFLILATVRLTDIIEKIKIDGLKSETTKNGSKLFFLFIPIRPKNSTTKFVFMHGPDLEMWLNAFAIGINQKSIYKAIKKQHTLRVANANSINGDALESLLPYKEMVAFYQDVWRDFMKAKDGKLSMPIFEEKNKAITYQSTDDFENQTQSIIDQSKNDFSDSKIKNGTGSSKDNERPLNGHQSTPPLVNGNNLNGKNEKSQNGFHHRAINGNGNAKAIEENNNLTPPTNQKHSTARLEFCPNEELKKSIYYLDKPDGFVTVIYIDSYKNQYNEGEEKEYIFEMINDDDCILRL